MAKLVVDLRVILFTPLAFLRMGNFQITDGTAPKFGIPAIIRVDPLL